MCAEHKMVLRTPTLTLATINHPTKSSNYQTAVVVVVWSGWDIRLGHPWVLHTVEEAGLRAGSRIQCRKPDAVQLSTIVYEFVLHT